jgi:DNA-binding HxlR family transcriptional regulator
MDGTSLAGRVARLIAGKFFDTARRHGEVKKELERTGNPVHGGDLSRKLKELVAKGFLTLEEEAYQAVREMKVRVVAG